jgi:hypothetical protein
MDAELTRVLESTYPGEEARYFSPLSIGSAPEHADEGAVLILNGVRRVMVEFYRTSATRHGAAFTDDTALIWEWFAVVRRL